MKKKHKYKNLHSLRLQGCAKARTSFVGVMHKMIFKVIAILVFIPYESFAESYTCFPKVEYPEIEEEFILPLYNNGDGNYHSSILDKEQPSSLVMRFPLVVNRSKFTGLSFFYFHGEPESETFYGKTQKSNNIKLSGHLYWSEYDGKAHSEMTIDNAWDKLSISIYYGSCGPSYSCRLVKKDNKFDFQCKPPKVINLE